MRDGVSVMYDETANLTYNQIVKAMVGRELDEQFPHRTYEPQDVVLNVKRLNNPLHHIENQSFYLKEGEILGVSGLMGAGRTEMMRSLFGVDKADNEIEIKGQTVSITSPIEAMKHGLAFITENRKEEGLILDFSIKDNMVLPSLFSFSKHGIVDDKSSEQFVDTMRKRLNIKSPGRLPAGSLSGGNQQKVVLAKWIGTGAQIIILDEPTRGIDVGAKERFINL